MNKIHIIGSLLMLFVAMFSVSLVLAEENTTDVAEPALISAPVNVSIDDVEADLGLNESVSDGEIAWEGFKLWFMFNQEKKINAELELARLRLAQANRAAERNDTEAMEKAMEKHEKIMNKVQERMDKFEISSDVNDSATKLLGLERAIQVHEQRIEFLNYVLEGANLTDEQRAKVEERMSKLGNVTARLDELQQEKQDKMVARLMAEGNLTEEQARNVLEIMRPFKEDREDLREANKQAMEQIREANKQAMEQGERVQERIRERVEQNSSDESEDETEDETEIETEDSESSSNGSGRSS